MTFKDAAAQDIHNIFLNPDELAEVCTIQYDGEEYGNIPVSLQDLEMGEREQLAAGGFGRGRTDGAPGLYQVKHALYCALSDIGGKVPKQGKTIQIKDGRRFPRKYTVAAAGCEAGMVWMDLERIGE